MVKVVSFSLGHSLNPTVRQSLYLDKVTIYSSIIVKSGAKKERPSCGRPLGSNCGMSNFCGSVEFMLQRG